MRKFIDIINEFVAPEFNNGGGGGEHVQVYDISWDTDGEDVDLPTEIVLALDEEDDDDLENAITDELSNRFGFCVNGFQYHRI